MGFLEACQCEFWCFWCNLVFLLFFLVSNVFGCWFLVICKEAFFRGLWGFWRLVSVNFGVFGVIWCFCCFFGFKCFWMLVFGDL